MTVDRPQAETDTKAGPAPTSGALQLRGTRRRRRAEALRLLPLLGLFLFLLPLLWTLGAAGGSTALVGLYLFAAWAVLILGAGWLSRGLASEPPEPHQQDPE